MDEVAEKMDDLPVMVSRHRREGFPGQHQVVLPAPVIAAARVHPLLQGLFVTDAGRYPKAKNHRVTRKDGAGGTILIFCAEGCGWVESQGRRHEVGAGDFIFLGPNESHSYGAAAENPWTIEWTHFSGNEAADWRASMVGTGCFAKLHPSAASTVELARVHEHLEAGYDETQLLLAAVALRASLTELLKLRRVPNHALTAVEAVESTAEWMRNHLYERVTLAALAGKAGMSASQYSAIFRGRFGFSPIDWFTRQRVQQACRLLDMTREKVEVIGLEVGFSDPYYFSRTFKKIMGCSPKAYRGIEKG